MSNYPTHYNIITNSTNEITFTGTLRQAWDYFVTIKSNPTVSAIIKEYKIKRA
jgi:hypothetical protein